MKKKKKKKTKKKKLGVLRPINQYGCIRAIEAKEEEEEKEEEAWCFTPSQSVRLYQGD